MEEVGRKKNIRLGGSVDTGNANYHAMNKC